MQPDVKGPSHIFKQNDLVFVFFKKVMKERRKREKGKQKKYVFFLKQAEFYKSIF